MPKKTSYGRGVSPFFATAPTTLVTVLLLLNVLFWPGRFIVTYTAFMTDGSTRFSKGGQRLPRPRPSHAGRGDTRFELGPKRGSPTNVNSCREEPSLSIRPALAKV